MHVVVMWPREGTRKVQRHRRMRIWGDTPIKGPPAFILYPLMRHQRTCSWSPDFLENTPVVYLRSKLGRGNRKVNNQPLGPSSEGEFLALIQHSQVASAQHLVHQNSFLVLLGLCPLRPTHYENHPQEGPARQPRWGLPQERHSEDFERIAWKEVATVSTYTIRVAGVKEVSLFSPLDRVIGTLLRNAEQNFWSTTIFLIAECYSSFFWISTLLSTKHL